MIRSLICVVALLIANMTILFAQEIHHVKIGINGLHCSACTFSVEKSLRKLPNVSVVNMDLNARKGEVYLKNNQSIDYHELAKAVVDAGFSVRSFTVIFKDPIAAEAKCVNNQFCIIDKYGEKGDELRLIGKGFQDRKSLKAMKDKLALECRCENAEIALKAIAL